MIAVTILGILSVLLCLLINDKNTGLKWAFFCITLFLCFRYGWGNDYMGYLRSFNEYKLYSYGLFDIKGSGELHRNNEFGWVILNRLFGRAGFGFFGLIIALSLFENWVVYRMVSKYVPSQYYWVAVLFFVFSTSFCVNASMIRMYLAMCLYLLVVDLMVEKQVRLYWLWSIGILLLGTTIHRSCIAMFVTLPLFFIKIQPGKGRFVWMAIGLLAFVTWSNIGSSFIETNMLRFIDSNEDITNYIQYIGQEKTGVLNSGLGIIFRYIVFITWLWLLPSVDNHQRAIVILGLASYFFEPVIAIAPIAGRFQMYLASMDLLRWAWLFKIAKEKPLVLALFVGEIAILFKTFFEFFQQPVWIDYFLHYHTIFEAGGWM